ncbi:hypothetical protein [Adhaeribacter soli]|uniref:Lipoprotein n=1 Tax=Adhaeribacter soli TaxID=2607655 RepID=A0A5N1IK28_9BACT|nr:hypothetical protein [Adhaeribacter soli]KAA9325629.1 hypothetical protein F0P94_16975 [Adhaeribacter soli]
MIRRKLFPALALGILLLGSCKDEKATVKPATPATPVPTSDLYFVAKIDGADFMVEALKNNYGSGAGSSSGNSSGPWVEEQSLLLMNTVNQHVSGVLFVKTFANKPDVCSQIETMVKPGVYPFGKTVKGTGTPAKDGIVIVHTDANGKYWTSDFGTGDQTGSTFEVVEHIANNDGFSQRITKARFNCKLYDGQGNSKTLTNGEIRSRSVQCGHL